MTEAATAQAGEGVVVSDGDTGATNETETRARRLGWVPQDEFKGDPDKHRSAEEFLKRGEEIVPLLKRDNDKLHAKFDKVERELAQTRETLKEFSEFASKGEERAYKRAKDELEARLDTAISTADLDSARVVRRELEALEPPPKPKPAQEATNAATVDPIVSSWIDENQWFNKSQSLRSYAVEEFGDLEKQFPGKSKSELLAEVKQRTMDRFPDKFGINPKREGAAAVSTPGGVAKPPKKGGKSYDDLPAEAKKACDKYVKQIPNYTREKYVKDYDWDN